MATAYYPQGMVSYNNSLNVGGYKSWKGDGYFSNPTGITWGNMRPFTNKDPYNNIEYKPGLARPLKQYRKGISVVSKPINPEQFYQENREVKSRGTTLVSQLMDYPGCFSVNGTRGEPKCDCKGVPMITGVYPNVNYYDNPPVIMQANNVPIVVNKPGFCCSQPKNALRLLRTSTNLKQNYYTTTQQYLQNRCQTYDQRIFNFVKPIDFIPDKQEGYYVANCLPNFIIKEGLEKSIIDTISRKLVEYNTEYETIVADLDKTSLDLFLKQLYPHIDSQELIDFINAEIYANRKYLENETKTKNCSRVIYKPSNPQFAVQGAVSASTLILKKDVVTLEKYGFEHDKYNPSCLTACGNNLNVPAIRKTKSAVCVKNGSCNGNNNITTYGNRPSKYAYLNPKLYNRKYTPSYTLGPKGEIQTYIVE
jgi:hypothetical protein